MRAIELIAESEEQVELLLSLTRENFDYLINEFQKVVTQYRNNDIIWIDAILQLNLISKVLTKLQSTSLLDTDSDRSLLVKKYSKLANKVEEFAQLVHTQK